MVSFAEPTRLVLLVIPVLAGLLVVFRHRRRVMQQRRLASPAVWDRLMGGLPSTGLWRLMAWCLAAVLILLALARPQWGELPVEQSVRTRDLVMAVDVSDSMRCPDVAPSRLARSLEVFQRVLPQLEGNRVGVVVFAGEAYPLVPLTTDLHAAATFLSAVEAGMVGLPGSNLEMAVATSLELLPPDGEGRVVIVFTDGENLQGNMEGAGEALRESGASLLAVVAGTAAGGPIPTLAEDGSVRYKRDGDGQPVVTRARPEVLKSLADAVDGETMSVAERDPAARLAAAVNRLRTREAEATRKVERIDRFPIFLALGGLLVVAGFGLSPWRRAVATAAVLLALVPCEVGGQQPVAPQGHASAGAVAEAPVGDAGTELRVPWWQRLIPGGSRRLARDGARRWRAGEMDDAARSFARAALLDPESPQRQYDLGTVLGAGGQLEQAAAMLARAHEGGAEDAAYNLGTASLAGQQAELAVQWLRTALLDRPEDPEVKRNYELALRMLEAQQQQQDQQQDEQQDQQDQQEEQEPQPQDGSQTPTPTPTSDPQGGPQPTPTPDPNQSVYAALERAEAEARDALRSPTPSQRSKVEKDW